MGVALKIFCHNINTIANAEGVIPTLRVFSNIPKIITGNVWHLCPNQREWFETTESAREEMDVIVAFQRLEIATEYSSKPVQVFFIPPGDEVLIHKEKSKNGKGVTKWTSTTTTKQFT